MKNAILGLYQASQKQASNTSQGIATDCLLPISSRIRMMPATKKPRVKLHDSAKQLPTSFTRYFFYLDFFFTVFDIFKFSNILLSSRVFLLLTQRRVHADDLFLNLGELHQRFNITIIFMFVVVTYVR